LKALKRRFGLRRHVPAGVMTGLVAVALMGAAAALPHAVVTIDAAADVLPSL